MSTVRSRVWDAGVLIVVLVVLSEVLTTDQDVPLALSVPVALAMTVPLLWGQRHPEPVAAVVLGAWVVQSLAGDWQQEPQSELLPVCVAFWCLGAHIEGRRSLWALAGALAALVVHEPEDVVVLGPLMVGVYAAGRLMQSRERLAAALEHERAQAERYAVAEERARIARELHDAVGHAIATMTVQAGAERMALGDRRPETSRVLQQIEVTGRETLQEMRRLVGVLRTSEDAADLAPQPGLARLAALAEQMERSGLAVDLRLTGELADVPTGVDISAYRIVQEGLTNVLKHADARRARVRVDVLDGYVRIEVTDDGQARPTVADRTGHGLSGMRERVLIFGGSCEAGPGPDGGWRLRARLPMGPSA